MKFEKITLNQERNVTLTAFVQPVGGEFPSITKRPAILILPGGGYQMCSDREAEPVAYPYLAAGFHAFVLRYSVKEDAKWPNPLSDYEQAMELLIDRAEEWHIDTDRIAVVGFSAGGHLAACAATISKHRPAAAILGYPAIKRDIVDMCRTDLPYPAECVDDLTCPCFLFAARDDNTVHISSTLLFAEALAERGINFETHIYSFGGHGFSTGIDSFMLGGASKRISDWVSDSIQWLGEAWGAFCKEGYTKPAFGRAVNGDREKFLSANCTVNHLRGLSDRVGETVAGYLDAIYNKVLGGYKEYTRNMLCSLFRLKDVLSMMGLGAEQIQAIDESLRKIENKIFEK